MSSGQCVINGEGGERTFGGSPRRSSDVGPRAPTVYGRRVSPRRTAFLSAEGLELVSAALRHVRDAEHLASAGPDASPDQAYHLAGFGPECARKAALAERWLDLAIGHGFSEVGEDVLELAVALDPRAARYNPGAFAKIYPALGTWDVSCRYRKTGSHKLPDVQAICRQARAAVDAIVVNLWLDGQLPDGEELA